MPLPNLLLEVSWANVVEIEHSNRRATAEIFWVNCISRMLFYLTAKKMKLQANIMVMLKW